MEEVGEEAEEKRQTAWRRFFLPDTLISNDFEAVSS